MQNVEIVVEDEPTAEQIADGHPDDGELFGLYEGTPLVERGGAYTMTLPDRIIIFRGPLERAFEDRQEMIEEVRITVLHEIAHHFGFDEDHIDRMGLA